MFTRVFCVLISVFYPAFYKPNPHLTLGGSTCRTPVRRIIFYGNSRRTTPRFLLTAPPMTAEATLGNANLLQLVEALFLNAEKVQPGWDSGGFGDKFLITARPIADQP